MEIPFRSLKPWARALTIAISIVAVLLTGIAMLFYIADSNDHRQSMNLCGQHPHDRAYEKAFGVKALEYDAFVAKYGEPERTEIQPEEQDYSKYFTGYYPGFSISYVLVSQGRAEEPGSIPRLVQIAITDENYRFGINRIGVGSTKKEVRAAYACSRPIDADELPYSERRFLNVDEGWYGDFWCRILFRYDGNDCVAAMAYQPSAFW